MNQEETRSALAGTTVDTGPAAAQPVPAREVEVELSALPERDVVTGSPRAGSRTVHSFADVEVGIWEITPGTARDVEADEVFVVLAGAASIRFDDGRETTLRPGDVMSLSNGQRTEWTVTETLRKVYVLHSDDASQE